MAGPLGHGAYRPGGRHDRQGSLAWLWVGVDERGRELEVVAVQAQSDRDPEPVLLVIHVMPTETGVGWAGAA